MQSTTLNDGPQPRAAPGTAVAPEVRPVHRRLTMEEVGRHNTADDCWIVVSGRVYDVTDFLSEHPAGRGIVLMHAGRDCTAEFLEVHSEAYIPAFAPKAFVGVLEGAAAADPLPRPRGAGRVDFDSGSVLALKRDLFGPEHETFRLRARAFLKKHVVSQYSKFEMKGMVSKEVYAQMAKEGLYLTLGIPRELGGLGLDWRFNAVVCEEIENADCGGFFANLGNDMVLSYFTSSCTKEQQARWIPMLLRGAVIAVAMSEPEVGSDLGRLSCTAAALPDGSGWVVNGRKMWVSSGAVAELVVVACVTDPSRGAKGISLVVVEKGMEGFSCAKRFGKLGKHASDTCLLTLTDVHVPRANLVGEEGQGFVYMMQNLPKERLSIAVGSIAAARRAIAMATNYVNGRAAFGSVVGGLQSVQLKLAQMRTEVQVCTSFVDRCIEDVAAGRLSAEAAAMAKVSATELAFRVADGCAQFFGGYGYLKNSPIGKMMVDQRVTRVYGGANEVQLEIIAKGLGFQPQRAFSKL